MRDLSIHITESSLRLILGDLEMKDSQREDIITHIINKAKAYSCTGRIVTISTEQQKKEVERIVKSNISDTKLLANTLLMCRRKLRHKGIRQVTEGTKDWLACKDIAENANIFCKDFGLDKRQGYVIYLELILPKVKVFSINFLNRYHEEACSLYESKVELERDETPSKTKQLYDTFQQMAINTTGIGIPYINDYTKYVFFKRAKDFCESVTCPYNEYLQAQFDGLEFARAIPIPEQLVGPQAVNRLQRYAIKEGNGHLITRRSSKKINWDKIKESEEL